MKNLARAAVLVVVAVSLSGCLFYPRGGGYYGGGPGYGHPPPPPGPGYGYNRPPPPPPGYYHP